MSNKKKHDQKGIIALTTLIIVIAIMITGGITLLLTSIDTSVSTEAFNNRLLAKIRSRACLEEGLYRIKQDPLYIGTVTLTFADGDCDAVVTDSVGNPGIKILDIDSTIEEFGYSSQKAVDTNADPIVLVDVP